MWINGFSIAATPSSNGFVWAHTAAPGGTAPTWSYVNWAAESVASAASHSAFMQYSSGTGTGTWNKAATSTTGNGYVCEHTP